MLETIQGFEGENLCNRKKFDFSLGNWTCEFLFVKSYEIRYSIIHHKTHPPFLKYVRVYRLVNRAQFFVIYAVGVVY